MNRLFEYINVYFDSASQHKLEEINERNYIQKLLSLLQNFMGEDFYSFNFYFLFSHDSLVNPVSSFSTEKNKILFWFSDESGTSPLHLKNNYAVIFKSYIKVAEENIYPMPLGFLNDFEECIKANNFSKDISLFFSGNLNENRLKLYNIFFLQKFKAFKIFKNLNLPFSLFFFYFKLSDLSIKKLNWNIFFTRAFKRGFAYDEYMKLINRSLYVLCPRGFQSSETFRHIEALANNCIVISESMPPVSIYQGCPFLIYKNPSELELILNNIKHKKYHEGYLLKKHKEYYFGNLEINAVAKNISDTLQIKSNHTAFQKS